MPKLLVLIAVLLEFASGAELRIRVHNDAPASGRCLKRATVILDGLLRQASITPIWIDTDSPATAMIASAAPACPRTITLRVLQSEPEGLPSSALGYVQPSVSSVDVTILFRRVMDLSTARAMEPGTLVGYVAAHEIVHALLQRRAHSPWGLMAQRWSDFEFDRMRYYALGFDSGDAKLMRALLDGEACEADDVVGASRRRRLARK
jgi:hypothetical protein